ncbi:zinc-dependent peptidase [Pleionea sediminis]|uniref:M90 family metallopeptidase n=1 Tax=Pleionea sediminis TaxID=2569479 RepID=UPI001FE4E228|nr:zinc-dependent peptidase [Pleionea sediminis]
MNERIYMGIVKNLFGWLFDSKAPNVSTLWRSEWSDFLNDNVVFYRNLPEKDKDEFHRRVLLFWQTTAIEAGPMEVTDEDRLLVAASAIIPVWSFPNWYYFNLKSVFLMRQAFNADLEFNQPDSRITGMVGVGVLSGKLVLSKPHLHLGFVNSQDKHNVGIHEFVHLIDMADGDCDGFPERLKEFSHSIPWFELVRKKVEEIEANQSNIRAYGATNRAEFFAVASEYFFERPDLLFKKHPELFDALQMIYQQDTRAIAEDLRPKRNAPCLCGSGKKYKRCCMPAS